MIDLSTLEYIPAYWQFPITNKQYDLAVIHCMETWETDITAESLGYYFNRHREILDGTRKASVHIGADSNSAVRYAQDDAYVYGAGGANYNGLHIELAGFSAQSQDEWLDDFGRSMLPIAADVVAAWCNTYSIPPVFLDAATLASTPRPRGITTHREVTFAYNRDNHTDPGTSFPLDQFMRMVHVSLAEEIARSIMEYPCPTHDYSSGQNIEVPLKVLLGYQNMELSQIRRKLYGLA